MSVCLYVTGEAMQLHKRSDHSRDVKFVSQKSESTTDLAGWMAAKQKKATAHKCGQNTTTKTN